LLLIAAACGDDANEASEATPAPSTAETTPPALIDGLPPEVANDPYLRAISEVSALRTASNEAIDETLNQTWPIRSRLIETLLEADRPGLATDMLERVNALDPPEEYAADHALFVQILEASRELAQQEQDALEDEDLVRAVLLLADLRLLQSQVLFPALSRNFCLAIERGAEFRVCNSDVGIGEVYGDYGEDLYAVFERYRRDFGPRVSVFYAALSPAERFASLRILQPQIIAAMDRAIDEIEVLTPPQELAADHDRLLQYFTEIRQTALDINAAVEAEDTPLLLQHFGFSGVVTCSAANDLSEAIDPLVGFFFPLDCDAAG
jgi:2-phospho-L-lactate guanylyltransferase (CobY/MobA/RfbA family)